MDIALVLADPNFAICESWRKYFEKLPNVEITQGKFEFIAKFDCMVSPANSFGLMDGGVDAAITEFFGTQLMQNVQQHIINYYMGEQPVGTSFIIATGHDEHPWLAHTPTMRVPLDISSTDNVYLAMWAMLRAVYHHNQSDNPPIKRIVCPGLGTGFGQMLPEEAARQMALAYKNHLNPPDRINWHYAQMRQVDVVKKRYVPKD